MLTYSRAGGGTFLSAFSNAMRENPLPSLMIGAGCMMFLSEKMGLRPGRGDGGSGDDLRRRSLRRYPHACRSSRSDCVPGVDRPGLAASSARSAAGFASSSLTSAAEAARGRASAMTGAVAESARQAASTVGDTVGGRGRRRPQHGARPARSGLGAVEQMRRGAQTWPARCGTAPPRCAMRAAAMSAARDTYVTSDAVATAASMSSRVADAADQTRRRAWGRGQARARERGLVHLRATSALRGDRRSRSARRSRACFRRPMRKTKLMGESERRRKGRGAGGQSSTAPKCDLGGSAKNVASKVADRAQTAAKEEGLSPSAVAEAARNLREEIATGRRPCSKRWKQPARADRRFQPQLNGDLNA